MKLFLDNAKLCLGRNSVASHRNYSKTIPNCVLAKIQLHFIGIILRQLQIVSWPIFRCIPSTYFKGNSKGYLSRKSIASHRRYSKTIPSCVLSKIQKHLIEIILRQSQNMSWPKFNCISLKLFQDNSKLCPGRISTASHRKYSYTIPNRVLAEIELHLIEITLRQFQLCPGQNSIASHRNYSKTIPNCVSAEIQLQLIEIIPGKF